MNFIIAVAVLVFGYWAIKKIGKAKPSEIGKLKSQALGLGVTGFGAFLMLKGSVQNGFGAVALGLAILGKDKILPEFLRRSGPAQPNPGSPPQPPGPRMDRAEALKVLALAEGASEMEIREAHKRLLKDFHPDKGGSNYLAAKINEAKDVLLKAR